jgi:muramoyltetrapeptide carboxypeptidase
MILNLKRNKKFSKLKGLIVGKMKGMHDNTIPFGKTANEIIYDYTREFNFPICFEFPSGHIKNNSPLIFNKNTLLKIENTGVTLIQ